MRLYFSIFFFILVQSAFSQQDKIAIPTTSKEVDKKYDTIFNIEYCLPSKKYCQYINQDILFYERSANSNFKSTLYGNFYLQTPDTIWHKIRKKPKPSDYTLIKRYKGNFSTQGEVCFGGLYVTKPHFTPDYYTPAKEVEGKKFKIINIEKRGESIMAPDLIFTLLSEKNDTVLWHTRILSYTYRFPCIIYSFYQRVEQEYVNNTFIIQDQKYRQEKGIDIKNGEKVVLDDTLICTSLSFVDFQNNFKIPCLILTGNSNRVFAIPITQTPNARSYLDSESASSYEDRDNASQAILTNIEIIKEKERLKKEKEHLKEEEEHLKKEEIENERKQVLAEKEKRCLKKFGKEITRLILENKVRIGMTKDMCTESWGMPKDINKTIREWGVHEQWVYSSSYLYFENGLLTTIQN